MTDADDFKSRFEFVSPCIDFTKCQKKIKAVKRNFQLFFITQRVFHFVFDQRIKTSIFNLLDFKSQGKGKLEEKSGCITQFLTSFIQPWNFFIFPRIGDGQCGLQYDLDAPEEGGICVNIFPVLTKEADPNVPSSR